MDQLYAVMDIGTNSVRLMLARCSGRVEVEDKRICTTRIGEALHSTGELSEGGMERSLSALAGFLETAREAGATQFFAFATSAVRDAKNRQEFLDRCREKLGLEVDVISGREEAGLGFAGIGVRGQAKLIDIGGGSTEISCGAGGRVSFSFSVPVGCVRALERYPETEDGLLHARKWLHDMPMSFEGEAVKAGKLMQKLRKAEGPAYAIGGTATAIASLAAGLTQRYDARIVTGRALTLGEVRRINAEMGRIPVENRKKIPLLGKRAEVIRFGAALLEECMVCLDAPSVITSDADNLEGYLLQKVGKLA